MPPKKDAARHDQLFKKLLRSFFGDFLRIVVPAFAGKLRPEKARAHDKEFFTHSPKGKRREVDLLFEVPAKKGRARNVLVHVEVEGQARKTMAHRMWRYSLAIRRRYDRPLIPIVLYIRGGKPDVTRETYRHTLWGEELVRFTYWAFSLSRSDARKYLARPEPISWALAAMMKPGELRGHGLKIASLERIAAGEVDEGRRDVLVDFVETELQLTEEEQMAYQEALATEEHRDIAELEMTWLGRARARGREEGREQGREEGEQEGLEKGLQQGLEQGLERGLEQGLQEALLAVLRRRFGRLPAHVVEAARSIDSRQRLTELVTEAAVVETLDELPLDGR